MATTYFCDGTWEVSAMRQLMDQWWTDDGGAVIAAEWILVATLLILGAVAGLVAVRQAVVAELSDVINAFVGPNQGYGFSGQSQCESSMSGTQFIDTSDSLSVRSTAAVPSGADNHACD
jgi:hypothetical protein